MKKSLPFKPRANHAWCVMFNEKKKGRMEMMEFNTKRIKIKTTTRYIALL